MAQTIVWMNIKSFDIPTSPHEPPSLDIDVTCGRFSTVVTVVVTPQAIQHLEAARDILRAAQKTWEEGRHA